MTSKTNRIERSVSPSGTEGCVSRSASGLGSQKMPVKPDDPPAKRAKNRRYAIQVQL